MACVESTGGVWLWGDLLGGHLFAVYVGGLRICIASGVCSAATPLLRRASDAALAMACTESMGGVCPHASAVGRRARRPPVCGLP